MAGAWLAFTTSALCVLRSFLSSQACHKQLIKDWDETYANSRPADSARSDILDEQTARLNKWAGRFFILGIVSLGVFVIANLMR